MSHIKFGASVLNYFSVLCLGNEEGKQFKLQEEMYENIWRKCKINTTKKPVTSLNKELRKAVDNFTFDEKSDCIDLDIDYQVKKYKDTAYPITPTVAAKKKEWHMQRQIPTEFRRMHDNKWRHPAKIWAFFKKFVPTIETIFDKLPHLKEHIYGPDNLNFRFSKPWIESRSQWMIHFEQQIERCEKTSNINYQSNWDLNEQVLKYTVGGDGVPLRDAFQK